MKPIKLLLIDDNEDNKVLIKFSLKIATNWQILTADNGIEGIAKAESEQPDVILLDLIMPDIDGLTVYEVLKQNLFTCTIPIVFVTAMVNKKVLSQLRNTGANGIITKPLNTVTLADDIVQMCELDSFSNRKKNRLKTWDGEYSNADKEQLVFN